MNWCCFWGQEKMQQSWHPRKLIKRAVIQGKLYTRQLTNIFDFIIDTFVYWWLSPCVSIPNMCEVFLSRKSALKLEIIVSFDVYWKLNYFFLWKSNKCSYTLRHLSFPLLFYFKLSFYDILWEFLLIWRSRFSFYHQKVLHYCM